VNGRLLCRGCRGADVSDLKQRLIAIGQLGAERCSDDVEDVFDDPTDLAVRAFQQARGLNIDGIVGPSTLRSLDEAAWQLGDRVLELCPDQHMHGDDVAALQHRLLQLGFAVGRIDGVFGPVTAEALSDFQANVGLPSDGAAGPATFKALHRLSPVVSGGRADVLRDHERLHVAGPRLSGKAVVVDPGHGGDDPGHQANGLVEAELTYALAQMVADRLSRGGVSALLTRGPHDTLTDDDRARFANSRGADLLVSLHFDANTCAHARGVSSYYFGSARHPVRSVVGERMADLVNREIAARTGMLNGRSHPKTWDLLRFTTMPTVHLELGYLTNSDDAANLTRQAFLDAIADSIVVSVQRLYLPPEMDTQTGRLQLGSLMR
jgi:N-acetylmuramoyl-L-alanine amidase